MNIYLDVDGVILANDTNAALYADEFLQTILSKFPDTTYWLTTHCWKGDNRAAAVVSPFLKPGTAVLLNKIKAADWGELKTDAIDFSKPFLWFDDNLYPGERKVLEANDALDNWIEVDLSKDSAALRTITLSLPKIIDERLHFSSRQESFIAICQHYHLDETQAVMLQELIASNDGQVNTIIIRGNFPISYTGAAELATTIAQNGYAKIVERIPNMKQLPKEKRTGGWFSRD
ncbi:MAG: hypothetical protein NVS1B10_07360 [Candidatus Saccharimonadales bacterium]